jgi:selenoprotein W-related protein
VGAVRDLLGAYQHVIRETRVIHGSGGVFDVVVDGRLLYSKKKTGRHAQPGEVLRLFSELVGSDVPRYGT